MFTSFILLITLIFQSNAYNNTNNPIITIKYQKVQDEFFFPITLSKYETENLYIEISLSSNFTFLSISAHLNKGISLDNCDSTILSINNRQFKGYLLSSNLILKERPIELIHDFSFYYINSSMIDRYAWLGLSLGNTNPKFSLVHKMKEEHLINKLSFSFSPTYSSYLGIGEIHFGGISTMMAVNRYRSSCDSNTYYQQWNCKMKGIFIGNISNATSQLASQLIKADNLFIEANSKYFTVNQHFWNIINETFLNAYFTNRICEYKENFNKVQEIQCICHKLHNFPHFNFIFSNGNSVTLKQSDLFRQYNNICILYIKVNSLLESKSFEIGTPIMNSYHVLFDYETTSITWYSNYPFFTLKNMKSNELKFKYIILNIAILLIYNIFLFSIFCNKNKYTTYT